MEEAGAEGREAECSWQRQSRERKEEGGWEGAIQVLRTEKSFSG